MRPLSLLEARVLGVLVEKSQTVPDSYPLVAQRAHARLQPEDGARSGDRGERGRGAGRRRRAQGACRWRSSRADRASPLRAQPRPRARRAVAIGGLAGDADVARPADRRPSCARARAAASLRRHLGGRRISRRARCAAPDDKGGPLAIQLPRAPGAREQRWAHLLCGPVDTQRIAGRERTAKRSFRRASSPR